MQDQTSPQSFANELKRNDYKQYIASLFAPVDERDQIITIFLFENDIEQIYFKASSEMARNIRYKWWEEALDEIANGGPAKSPLLEQIKTHKIDTRALKEIISFYEKVATIGYCQTGEEIVGIFNSNKKSLELICQAMGENQPSDLLWSLHRISFISNSLLKYFSIIDGSHLIPISLEIADQYSYNFDLIKDQANNDKLKEIVKLLCVDLFNELNEVSSKLENKSRFLKAFIYSIKHSLNLLKTQGYDLKIKPQYNKFTFLLKILVSSI